MSSTDGQNIYNLKIPKYANEETHYLLTKGRITFSSYINRILFITTFLLVLVLFNKYYWYTEYRSVLGGFGSNKTRFLAYYFVWLQFYKYVLPFATAAFIIIQSVKRLHDVNKSGFLLLVPFYNVYLLFANGTKGNNDYGIDPQHNVTVKYFDEIDEPQNTQPKKKTPSIYIRFMLTLGLVYAVIVNYSSSNVSASRVENSIQKKQNNTSFKDEGEASRFIDDDIVYGNVSVEARFPGGNSAWNRYINDAVTSNLEALEKRQEEGTLVVKFVIRKDGRLSNIVVLPCDSKKDCLGENSYLAQVVVKAIKRSLNWIPAKQNGKNVSVYRQQPVTFKAH
jgi:uncharacterized membrane protein YhaH (DUF805 family)